MKTLIFLLFFAVCTFGQSTDIEDYEKVYKGEKSIYYIDTTSYETVRNGNKVFWGMTVMGDTVILMSCEVNCQTRRFRMRALIMASEEKGAIGDYTPLTWMPKKDKVANAYISYVCGGYNWASLPKNSFLPLIKLDL